MSQRQKRDERKDKTQNISLFSSHTCAVLNYCKQLLGITVKLLAKAPSVIRPLQISGLNEAQLVLAPALTSAKALDTMAVSALVYSCTCESKEKVRYRSNLNNASIFLPFQQSEPTILIHKITDDALIIETSGVIQVDLNECLYEPQKGMEKSTKESLVTVIPK